MEGPVLPMYSGSPTLSAQSHRMPHGKSPCSRLRGRAWCKSSLAQVAAPLECEQTCRLNPSRTPQ
eukprot:4488404-Amphidinium_carterae.1